MQCIITGKQPNQFTNCDEAMNKALITQTVRVIEKPQLSHGGPSLRHRSDTDPPIQT